MHLALKFKKKKKQRERKTELKICGRRWMQVFHLVNLAKSVLNQLDQVNFCD